MIMNKALLSPTIPQSHQLQTITKQAPIQKHDVLRSVMQDHGHTFSPMLRWYWRYVLRTTNKNTHYMRSYKVHICT